MWNHSLMPQQDICINGDYKKKCWPAKEQPEKVETAWLKLKSKIIGAVKEGVGKRHRTGRRNSNIKPWFTQEIKSLAKKKQESYLEYRSKTITYKVYAQV